MSFPALAGRGSTHDAFFTKHTENAPRNCTQRGRGWRLMHEKSQTDCDFRARSAQDRAQLQAVATRLARAGASLEVADLEGRTALHLAAGCGDAAMVAHLLHLGADVNATDSVGGATPPALRRGRSWGFDADEHAAHCENGQRRLVAFQKPAAKPLHGRNNTRRTLLLNLWCRLQLNCGQAC